MQLLPRREVAVAAEKKRATEIEQVAFLTKALSDLQASINRENDAWNAKLEEQRRIYGEEKDRLQAEVKVLIAEVQKQSAIRAELMKPVDELRVANEKKAEALTKQEKELVEREHDLEERILLVQNRLDALKEMDSMLHDTEAEIQKEKEGVEHERKMVSDGHKRLNKMVVEFTVEYHRKIDSLSEREKSILAREVAYATITKEKEKRLFDWETDLTNRERALKDKQETLIRTTKRK